MGNTLYLLNVGLDEQNECDNACKPWELSELRYHINYNTSGYNK